MLDGLDFEDDATLDRLYEAGLDDASFGFESGVPVARVSRVAARYADAVLSAIGQIHTAGIACQVVRVEPDELLSAAEIAHRTGRSREGVRLLMAGERGPGGFPAPAADTGSRTRLWSWPDVAAWFAAHLGEPTGAVGIGDAGVTAAVNGALRIRRHLGALEDADLDLLRALLTRAA